MYKRQVSERFNDGDTARVDVEKATVENLASGSSFAAEPLSGEMLLILESGGIMEVLKSMMGEER